MMKANALYHQLNNVKNSFLFYYTYKIIYSITLPNERFKENDEILLENIKSFDNILKKIN